MVTKLEFTKIVEKQWHDFEIAAANLYRINLWGPTGVGKTFGAIQLRQPSETLSITLSEDIVAQELMGHYIPEGNQFKWHDGPVTTAFRTGMNVVVNELGRASSAVKDMFLGVLDNPEVARLTLPTGESVKPDSNFRVIATSNSSPEELDPALADRFEANILVQGPHPKLIAFIDKKIPGLGTSVAATYARGRKEEIVSPRLALTFIRLSEAGVGLEDAARVAFGHHSSIALKSMAGAR